MALQKLPNNRWLLSFRPTGVGGKYVRKRFDTKAEALRYKAMAEAESARGKEWNPAPVDRRVLSELVESWFRFHGQSLKDGEKRKRVLLNLCERLGDPVASQFSARDFTAYRENRLKVVSANTVNHEQAYLRAVFNELIRVEDWQRANPLEKVRAIRLDESELTFLSLDQITALFDELRKSKNPDALVVATICLSTGARWSEAESLRAENVYSNKVMFTNTKNGKNRAIPIDAELYGLLRSRKGRLFGYCYGAFRHAVQRSGIDLPHGQLSHVLRHTFASHFMMNGGNILVLQRVLGHADIKMTMRYAHFSPDHFEDVIRFNPISKWTQSGHITQACSQ
ncbi:phage integrase [Oceanospirillum sediminis]|uniref:Tyrosine-type recombinase/integrase n=1 Tax=Oceanospirillum sediminis TaxID=2760088 RepID=A0A839IKL8_9GAMM|nr:tyrosine-type recombinase/integrase [Oceanospirillum sediminis]MBB1485903.1 tyrosine-type recombinase/integrase [Oceanospirillum sediminis]